MIRFEILTLFPEFFRSPLAASLVGKAISRGVIEVAVTDVRDFAPGVHRVADDAPYGGGGGMLLKIEPVVAAIEAAAGRRPDAWKILLSPRGTPLSQAKARELAGRPALVLVCGHYEGIDERVRAYVDEELSLGDFVLAGGETAALAVVESVARLVPGFVGSSASIADESFETGILEYPHYTRPESFRGARVPDVLLRGDHAAVARWRRKEALRATRARRPDLLAGARLGDDDRRLLREIEEEES